ncbi:MAG: cation:dicarboxylase symporter family transporter [Parachlamydiales bacterium]|jgi:hypothetical protein
MPPAISKLLFNRSLQVFFSILLYLALAAHLPMAFHQALYTFSLLIKDLLLWILPFTVFFFIANALASFEKKAPLFVFALFAFEALSNFTSVWYAYSCGQLTTNTLPELKASAISDTFSSLWRLSILKPLWWSADKGTFAGIACGLLAAFNFPKLKAFIALGKSRSEWLLTRFFSRLIPLFVVGFVAKMYKTRILNQIAGQYADLLLWLVLILAAYICLLFLLGSGASLKAFFRHLKNMLPAAGIAFSSGCSLSTMPWTIAGASKNLDDPDLAKTIIPATTNIQQVGDCIANSFLCFLIYYHFNGFPPSLSLWLMFSLVFVLARFATAAVIGGSIFIMLPIYESYLGFTPEMIAIILAFNVILDPLITCSNVIANGALCRVFERLWAKILKAPVKIPS